MGAMNKNQILIVTMAVIALVTMILRSDVIAHFFGTAAQQNVAKRVEGRLLDPEEAIAVLTEKLRDMKSPEEWDLASAYLARAEQYERIHQYRRAIEDSTLALEHCPNNSFKVWVLERRSALYEKQGMNMEALHDAEKAYRFAYFTRWQNDSKFVDRIKRLTGRAPTVPVIENDRGSFLISVLQKMDASNGDWSQPVLTTITGEQFKEYSDSKSQGLTLRNNDSFWHIITFDNVIVFDWEPDQCTIGLDDINSAFVGGKRMPEEAHGCRIYPPHLDFERPWGTISFLLRSNVGPDREVVLVTLVKRPTDLNGYLIEAKNRLNGVAEAVSVAYEQAHEQMLEQTLAAKCRAN